ncbi:hypothetical protein R1sor_011105 [Riccia sorocarpa]|uniref:Uncharacterized protein n=1 Tax=Riccia sorocarpa TaxID=122646 RepID=A0ABD3I1S3_9MARC
MDSEDGFQLRELLRKEPSLLTVLFRSSNVLHLAIRKGWYGLVWEILRCFDHVLYDAGEVAVDPFGISAVRRGDGHPLHSTQTNDQVTHTSGNDRDADVSTSASGSHEHTSKPTSTFGPDERTELKTNAEADSTENASRRHNCLDLARFRNLLMAREGENAREKFYRSELDVFGMLVVGGNMAITVIIQEAYSRGLKKGLFEKGHPYASRRTYADGIIHATKRRNQREEDNQAKEKRHRALLRSICERIFRNDERREAEAEALAQAWELESPFLPSEEYLFLSVCRQSDSRLRASLFEAIAERAQDVDFLEYLFTISGPCGTVLHFTEKECLKNDLLHVFERMPIETQEKSLEKGYPGKDAFLPCMKRTPVEEIICSPFFAEQRTNMKSCFKSVLEMVDTDIMKEVKISTDGSYSLPGWGGKRPSSSVSFLGLTVLLRKRKVLKLLLEDDRFYDDGRLNPKQYDPSWWEGRDSSRDGKGTWCASILHLAAMQGDPDVIRQILTTKKFDPLVRDHESKTALHHAVLYKRPYRYRLHITDIPLIPKERISEAYMPENHDREEASESRRQGCINLLLGAGLDIWDTIKEAKLLIRALKHPQGIALGGPLQPPLGYGVSGWGSDRQDASGDLKRSNLHREQHAGILLRLGSIMLSLTPSLPVPQESVLDELKLTRRTVTVALVSLILSIIAILVAFAASSIAVVPDEGSWNHGGLTVSTLVIGGLWCMLILVVCIMRAVRLIFHKSQSLRFVYRRWDYR